MHASSVQSQSNGKKNIVCYHQEYKTLTYDDAYWHWEGKRDENGRPSRVVPFGDTRRRAGVKGNGGTNRKL